MLGVEVGIEEEEDEDDWMEDILVMLCEVFREEMAEEKGVDWSGIVRSVLAMATSEVERCEWGRGRGFLEATWKIITQVRKGSLKVPDGPQSYTNIQLPFQ